MSDLVLRLRTAPSFRLDLSPLTPERVAGQSAEAVARLPLRYGRRSAPVGEWFDVRGAGGLSLLIEGDGDRLDRIGADLRNGLIRVEGNAGAYLGFGMRGGRIEVSGRVDAYAACGLAGGVVRIGGDGGRGAGRTPGHARRRGDRRRAGGRSRRGSHASRHDSG